MSLTIEHDANKGRFSVVVDDQRCLLDYRLAGSTMTIVHTEVPTAVAGRGIAAELMQSALAAARANGWKIVPACSYAAAYMKKHTEYADLLA
jgi:uncharacterized protein